VTIIDTPSIWSRRHQLDKERQEFMKTAMAEFDKEWRLKRKALQDECAATDDGHNWRHTGDGPLGHPSFSCTKCHTTKVEGRDE
jgi:hypothetical protein